MQTEEKFPIATEEVYLKRKLWPYFPAIQALVVMDGKPGGHYASFGQGDLTYDAYFGLSEFIKTLTAFHPLGINIQVTKAHRDTDVRGAADIENFRFDQHDLSVYDEIFLFGVAGPGETNAPMTESELYALTEFMNGGGGVFATGDHEDLGVELCGKVPRVRSMRKWWYPGPGPNGEPGAPPALGAQRIETTQPGHNENFVHFDDQSDDIPQPIRPRYYSQRIGLFTSIYYPHPLLCSSEGVIKVLPDHMHEGEVIAPKPRVSDMVFTFNGKKFIEYPTGIYGAQLLPEIVAWGKVLAETDTSTESEHVGDPTHVATSREFGVIGAYDGHMLGLGRVAVDSTWHHFFDINLIGDPVAPAPKTMGFNASASGMQALSQIKAYYRNIAVWIARPGAHISIFASTVWYCLHNQPLSMIIHPAREYSYTDKLHIGKLAYEIIVGYLPPCSLILVIWKYFVEGPVKVHPPDPWANIPDGSPVIDPMEIVKVCLGSAIAEAGKTRLEKEKMDSKEAINQIIKSVSKGVSEGVTLLGGKVEEYAKSLLKYSEHLEQNKK